MPVKDERLVVKISGVITIESVGRLPMLIGSVIALATLTALSVITLSLVR